jgi:hypothetical protein
MHPRAPSPLPVLVAGVAMVRAGRRWLRQLKIEEYFMDHLFDHPNDTSCNLYWAVIEGRIRCRHNGRVLTAEEAASLRNKNWGHRWALPSDIEISVDDVVEEFENGQSKQRALESAQGKSISAKPDKGGRLQAGIEAALEACFPDGCDRVSNKHRNQKLFQWLKENGCSAPASEPAMNKQVERIMRRKRRANSDK